MRLPRILVRCLLATSALGVLTAAVWWWKKWPEQTLREFRNQVANRRFQELDRLLADDTRWLVVLLTDADLELEAPTAQDFLQGRRRFKTVVIPYPFRHLSADISVERGKIVAAKQSYEWPGQKLTVGVNDNRLSERLFQPNGWLAHTVAETSDDARLVEDLWWHTLGRPPTAPEAQVAAQHFVTQPDRRKSAEDIFWALFMSREFYAADSSQSRN